MKVLKTISAFFAVASISATSVYAGFSQQPGAIVAPSRAAVAPLGAPMVSGVRTYGTQTLGPVATQLQSDYYAGSPGPAMTYLQNDYGSYSETYPYAEQAWLAGFPAYPLGRTYSTGEIGPVAKVSMLGTPGVSAARTYYYTGEMGPVATEFTDYGVGQLYPGLTFASVAGPAGLSGLRYYAPNDVPLFFGVQDAYYSERMGY